MIISIIHFIFPLVVGQLTAGSTNNIWHMYGTISTTTFQATLVYPSLPNSFFNALLGGGRGESGNRCPWLLEILWLPWNYCPVVDSIDNYTTLCYGLL